MIIANKIDLVSRQEAQAFFARYSQVGYPVVYTSAKYGRGIDDLHNKLEGKISVFAGPSGAGKSSILNALLPGLDLKAREISQATSKGRHTTVVREMYPLPGGGYIADTPGLKALALWDIQPEELDGYFPEMRQKVAECAFSNCTHTHEPGCAILGAVEKGEIHPGRYQAYVRMREGEED
jgi:ribosome biogenesis GTPase